MSVSNLSTGMRPGVCTSTTRPTVPYEGQMIYETDTDMVAIWNGTAWRYISATTPTNGTVLQVAHGSTSIESSVSTAGIWQSTNVLASISPKSTSSKVLIQASLQYRVEQAADSGVGLMLRRSGNAVYTDSNFYGMGYSSNASGSSTRAFFQFLDNPASTSSTLYEIFAQRRGSGAAVSFQDDSLYASTITLMEIAG
jgi:hypothetical protein